MSPEKSPKLERRPLTAAERRQILTERAIDHTLEWYGRYRQAIQIALPEGKRPDAAPYAKLVGPTRVYKFERVRAVDRPFLQKVMALQVLSMPVDFPSALNADELVAEVRTLAGEELSKAEKLSQDRNEWPNVWLEAAAAVSAVDRALEKL